jgi:Tfp pilus assembly protein PilX
MTLSRLRGEDGGWALITTILFTAILMIVGMTSAGIADFNSQETRIQRERESSLALAEGVLMAQTFTLARQWPGASRASYPAECTSAAQTTGQCPNRNTLAQANSTTPTSAGFTGVDFLADISWKTKVRDNYGAMSNTYSTALADTALTGTLGTCPAPCTRDWNNDKAMWVQARAVVRGEVRNVVALMKMEQLHEGVPVTGLTSGAFKITTNTNSAMIDATGTVVSVRCVPDYTLNNQATCTDYRGGQVTPLPTQRDLNSVMRPEQIERFKERAVIDGTYHAGCPDTLIGRVVFVEKCLNPPNFDGRWATPCVAPAGLSQQCVNTIQEPGLLIVRCGAMNFTDTWTFVGLIYFVNGSDGKCAAGEIRGSSPPSCPSNSLDWRTVLNTQAGFGVWGSIAADGNACVLFQSRSLSLKFDPRAFSALASYGTVGLVQNTWRELPADIPVPTGTPGPRAPSW